MDAALQAQLAVLPTADTAREAVKKGFAVLTSSIDEAIIISDKIAPEHLEIQTRDAKEVRSQIDQSLLAQGKLVVKRRDRYCRMTQS